MLLRGRKMLQASWRTGVICALIVFSGCVYQTEDEIYFDSIAPPDGSDAFIDLGTTDQPIVLKQPTTFQFRVNPRGKKAYQVKVAIDFYPVYSETLTQESFTFSVDPADFQEGTRTMSIVVTYLTGSSSLAGQLDAETLTFQQDFTVVIEKIPAAPKPQVYIEDGRSMISWDPPANDNFSNLVIRRRYFGNENSSAVIRDLTVPDKHAVVFHDADYRGGDVSYSIILIDGDLRSESEPTFFHIDPLKVKVDSLASPYPVMSWEQSPLYNNDIEITIVGQPSHPIDQPGELEFPMTFGTTKKITMAIVPIAGPPGDGYTIVKQVAMGVSIPEFTSVHYYPADNSYVFLDHNTLRKVNADTWEELATASASGNLLVSEDHLSSYYLTSALQIVKFDPVSLSTISSFNLGDVSGMPANLGLLGRGRVTNDNLLACRLDGGEVVIDLAAHSILWSATSRNMPELTPDGNLLFHQGTLYSRTDGGWNTVAGSLNSWTSDWPVVFRQNDENQMFMKTALEIMVFNLDAANGGALTPERIESISSLGKQIIYQSESNTIRINRSVDGAEALYIYDANTFEVVRTSPGTSSSLSATVFVNGHLFHKSGFYLP